MGRKIVAAGHTRGEIKYKLQERKLQQLHLEKKPICRPRRVAGVRAAAHHNSHNHSSRVQKFSLCSWEIIYELSSGLDQRSSRTTLQLAPIDYGVVAAEQDHGISSECILSEFEVDAEPETEETCSPKNGST